MQEPKVSVIIPVFNAADTLEAALQSAFTQTYSNIEVIVVDGMSTDGSEQIIQKHSSKIYKLIREKDHGVYDAMNKGIAASAGEWIYIMGADDQLTATDVIANVMSHADSASKLLFGKVENVERKHALVPKIHISKFDGDIGLRNTLHQQSAFYHRSLFNHKNFNASYKILADYDFHLSLFEDRIQGKYVDILVARCLAGGLSKNFTWPLYREEIRMKRTHIPRQGLLFRMMYIPSVLAKFLVKKIMG